MGHYCHWKLKYDFRIKPVCLSIETFGNVDGISLLVRHFLNIKANKPDERYS